MAERTLFRAAAVLGAAGLLLVGCSSGEDTATPEATTSAESSAAAAPDCEPAQATAGPTPSTEPLRVGTLLPETGSLAFLGPPMIAGVNVAIEEINGAGGVLDQPVQLVAGDSGDDTTDTANQTVDRELGAGVQAIIGAAASGVTRLVIDRITGAGVVQFSPANTSDTFTCYADGGLYFRTAPPDLLQAQAHADLIASGGAQRIAILARNDPYGTGLAENTVANLEAAGIPSDQIESIIYDPNATSYNAEIDQVREFDPDAVSIIGFEEVGQIITRMNEVGIGPVQQTPVYLTDGSIGNALGEGLAAGSLAGVSGTTPLTELSPDFDTRLRASNPALVDINYAGEAYDSVIITALAAAQAGSTAGTDIASQINSVTQGGTTCVSYAECLPLAVAGTDLDYDGVIGTLDFTAAGEPGSGSYGILQYNAQNTIDDAATEYVIVGG